MLVYSEIRVAWNDTRDLFEHAVSCGSLVSNRAGMTAFFVHCAGPTEWYFGEWDLEERGGLLLLCVTTVAKDRG